jgi:hypothetical protein
MNRPKMPGALLLVMSCFFVGTLDSAQIGIDRKEDTTAKVREFYSAAVQHGTSDEKLDEVIPNSVLKGAWSAKSGSTSMPLAGQGAHITYRQAIKAMDGYLVETLGQVDVTFKAHPSSCLVKYTAVAGGGPVFDAGTTTAMPHVDPKWYVFTCDCTSPPQKQVIDATSSTTFSFLCPLQGKSDSSEVDH